MTWLLIALGLVYALWNIACAYALWREGRRAALRRAFGAPLTKKQWARR